MKTKVTIQDIADALNLSRITVSKVLNHSPNVSAETRDLVLKKAQEMNYKSANAANPSAKGSGTQTKSFAFIVHRAPDAFHIGSWIMTQLEQEIRTKGYSLTLHTITMEDVASLMLPPNLNKNQTAAIVCVEMFYPDYSKLICSLGIPVLFIDACVDFYSLEQNCSLLLMENRVSTMRMLTALCEEHRLASIGFVGDKNHCISFRERYEAFLLAASEYGAETKPYGIIADDRFYSQPGWIVAQLRQKAKLPRLFFCANDVLAHLLMQALEELGYQVPGDVMVCGFDGLPSINTFRNSLTTVRIPCKELGICAAQLLLQKIQNPDSICGTTYLGTEVCFRDSAPCHTTVPGEPAPASQGLS